MALERRGIVLTPGALEYAGWPDLVHEARLNTLGLHVLDPSPEPLVDYVNSEAGQATLGRCRELGLDIEFETHVMNYLLPRDRFEREPSLFRMDDTGARNPDHNLCPSSERALEIVGERAAELVEDLRPTTHRYFLWPSDGGAWCRCRECRALTDSDQNLLVANRLLASIRRGDPQASLAALCYANTLNAPSAVRPEPGVFLEFAPIERSADRPLSDPTVDAHARLVEALDAALGFYGAAGAQALDYWLDCSWYSGWKRPSQAVRYAPAVVREDLRFYASRGIRNATCFGAWLDPDYFARFGVPPVGECGKALAEVG